MRLVVGNGGVLIAPDAQEELAATEAWAGTITLTRPDLFPAGVIAGTLSFSLQQNPDRGCQTALTTELYAAIP